MTWKITGAPGTGDDLLYSQAGTPTLDLRFASSKSLVDNVSGQSLIDFTRNSTATYVDSDGLIKSVSRWNQYPDSTSMTTGVIPARFTRTLNAGIAPDGSNTAIRFLETADNNDHTIYSSSPDCVGLNIATASVYVKGIGRRYVNIRLVNGSHDSRAHIFDLTGSGALVNVIDKTWAGQYSSGSISHVGDGWYKITVTAVRTLVGLAYLLVIDGVTSATPTLASNAAQVYAGDVTKGYYVWHPQTEPGYEATEYLPTTSTAKNYAPRFDHESSGDVTLRPNLLLWSQDFNRRTAVGTTSPGGWNLYSNVKVTPFTTLAPDGTLTASTIDFTTDTNSYLFQYVNPDPIKQYTFSVWLASGTKSTVALRVTGGASDLRQEITLTPVLTRYSITFTGIDYAGIDTRYSLGTGAGTFIMWGAQLEEGTSATDYYQTTDYRAVVPGPARESLGLLVEEQRTNLLLRSELIGSTSWTNQNSLTAVANSTDVNDPAGGTAASKLTAGSSTSQTLQGATLTAAQHTGSVYVRTQSGTADIRLIVFLKLSPFTVIGDTSATVTTTWQRISAVTSTATATEYNLALRVTTDGATVYAWGAQLEEGAFPTSYIPTTSATVTRNADVASITGTNFSRWYNHSEGTVFWDATKPFAVPPGGFPTVWHASNSSNGERVALAYLTESFGYQQVVVNSVNTVSHYPVGLSGVRRRKAAGGFATDDYYVVYNGSSDLVDTSGAMPTSVDRLFIGSGFNATNFLSGTISRLVYFDRRLGNATLQAITA